MILQYDKSFFKSLEKTTDKKLFAKIEAIILEIEEAVSLSEIRHLKKLSGFKNYYRIRLGDYRLGLEQINKNTLRLITIAHRKDIYTIFP